MNSIVEKYFYTLRDNAFLEKEAKSALNYIQSASPLWLKKSAKSETGTEFITSFQCLAVSSSLACSNFCISIKEQEILNNTENKNKNEYNNLFEFSCYVLCSIDYLEENPIKNKFDVENSEVNLGSKSSFSIKEGKKSNLNKNNDIEVFEEPFYKENNKKLDKYYVETNKEGTYKFDKNKYKV